MGLLAHIVTAAVVAIAVYGWLLSKAMDSGTFRKAAPWMAGMAVELAILAYGFAVTAPAIR